MILNWCLFCDVDFFPLCSNLVRLLIFKKLASVLCVHDGCINCFHTQKETDCSRNAAVINSSNNKSHTRMSHLQSTHAFSKDDCIHIRSLIGEGTKKRTKEGTYIAPLRLLTFWAAYRGYVALHYL